MIDTVLIDERLFD